MLVPIYSTKCFSSVPFLSTIQVSKLSNVYATGFQSLAFGMLYNTKKYPPIHNTCPGEPPGLTNGKRYVVTTKRRFFVLRLLFFLSTSIVYVPTIFFRSSHFQTPKPPFEPLTNPPLNCELLQTRLSSKEAGWVL